MLRITILLFISLLSIASEGVAEPAADAAPPSTQDPAPAATPTPVPAQPSTPEPDPTPAWARGIESELLWRQAGGIPFGVRLTTAVGQSKGALLVIPDVGDNPVSGPTAILHRTLPLRGWSVLTIDPPPLDPLGFTGWVASLPARIQAARAALADRGITRLILVGHGLGALAATAYVESPEGAGIERLALVGIPSYPERDPTLDAADLLSQATLPVLDLYGERDSAVVTATAEARRLAAKRAGLPYRQVSVPTDHHFTYQALALSKHLRGWLEPNH